jgi:hypothetical protein
MKTHHDHPGQGKSKSDRAFVDREQTNKQKGISNSGGQRSDQTSGKDANLKSPTKDS